MAIGIKRSKASTASINYETFPTSGNSTVIGDDFYIPGVGLSSLADAQHEDVFVTEVNKKVGTYLYSKDFCLKGLKFWFNDQNFTNAVSSISESETDDIDLYAKWYQEIYKLEDSYSIPGRACDQLNIETNDILFKWRNS